MDTSDSKAKYQNFKALGYKQKSFWIDKIAWQTFTRVSAACGIINMNEAVRTCILSAVENEALPNYVKTGDKKWLEQKVTRLESELSHLKKMMTQKEMLPSQFLDDLTRR